jgi:hypothetical protein
MMAQAGGPAVAVVNIWYTGASGGTGHLLVDRDGTTTVTDFEASGSSKAQIEQAQRVRAEVLRKAVTQLYQEGYQLKVSMSKDEMIFVKGQ